MKRKPKVLVIGTGGTISAKPSTGKLRYGEMPQDKVIDFTPRIREKFDIKTTNLFRTDSSDMHPEHWLTLANAIYYSMESYDGIVVTMGTDTLHFANSAIAFLIQNNNIPIVFTGSKVDPTQINTDARWNLKEAIAVAGSANLAETVTVFNHHIMRATRTKKINASQYEAFGSSDGTPIGAVEQFITLRHDVRKRGKRKPVLYTKLEPRVAIVKAYPGFDGMRVRSLVDQGVKGIVLEGYGLGNIPLMHNSLKEGIKYANRNNAVVAVTSDCFLGKYWQEIFELEIGSRLKGLKIIHCYDMLTEVAYVKLMWVLAQTTDYAEAKKMMQKNYAGEITKYSPKKARKSGGH